MHISNHIQMLNHVLIYFQRVWDDDNYQYDDDDEEKEIDNPINMLF